MQKRSAILLILFIFFGVASNAQQPKEGYSNNSSRPKVGVVLSGGGAKGLAHVGVLKYLEELEIPIDYIVGTSIGSIVGGFYALGYSADDLDSLVMAQDWDMVMSDKIPKGETSLEEKLRNEKFIISIPFTDAKAFEKSKKDSSQVFGLKANIPTGLVQGQNLYNLFTKLTVGYQDSIDFSTFPIPFACVAVDLNTNKEEVFHSGNIVEAIRASMAIPGYFAPVKTDNHYLVDGGILNNYPVDVAREMGADIIIGVDLHSETNAEYQEVTSLIDALDQMINLMEGNKTEKNRRITDIRITPLVSKYGTLDFDLKSMDALIDTGYNAALRASYDLQMLSQSLKILDKREKSHMIGPVVNVPKRRAINIERDSVDISQIVVTGISDSDMELLFRKTKIAPGRKVSGQDIDDAISFFYSTKAFSRVTYSLLGDSNPYIMRIDFEPGKQHQLGFGFRYDSEESAALLLDVGINQLKLYGFRVNLAAKLGFNPNVSVDGVVDFKSKLRLNSNYTFSHSNMNMFEGGERSSNISYYYNKFDLTFQNSDPRHSKFKTGVRYENCYFNSILTNVSVPPEYEITIRNRDFISIFGTFLNDNLDRANFPTKGIRTEISYAYYFNWFNEDLRPFSDIRFQTKMAFPTGTLFVPIFSLYGRWAMGENIPASHLNVMGGYQQGRYLNQQIPFAGLNNLYSMGKMLAVARADLRFNLLKSHYITATVNYAMSGNTIPEFIGNQGVIGASLGYSFDSFIGPVSLHLHWSDKSEKVGVYFNLGHYF